MEFKIENYIKSVSIWTALKNTDADDTSECSPTDLGSHFRTAIHTATRDASPLASTPPDQRMSSGCQAGRVSDLRPNFLRD